MPGNPPWSPKSRRGLNCYVRVHANTRCEVRDEAPLLFRPCTPQTAGDQSRIKERYYSSSSVSNEKVHDDQSRRCWHTACAQARVVMHMCNVGGKPHTYESWLLPWYIDVLVKRATHFLTFSGLLLHFQTAPVAAQRRSLFLVTRRRVAREGSPSCSLTRLRVLSSSAHYDQSYSGNWYITIQFLG